MFSGLSSDLLPQPASSPPPDVPGTRHMHDAVEALEKKMIADALAHNHWHKGKTSEMLGIPRKTLQRKIKKYRLG
jgi:arginine utilization regulatory protein